MTAMKPGTARPRPRRTRFADVQHAETLAQWMGQRNAVAAAAAAAARCVMWKRAASKRRKKQYPVAQTLVSGEAFRSVA